MSPPLKGRCGTARISNHSRNKADHHLMPCPYSGCWRPISRRLYADDVLPVPSRGSTNHCPIIGQKSISPRNRWSRNLANQGPTFPRWRNSDLLTPARCNFPVAMRSSRYLWSNPPAGARICSGMVRGGWWTRGLKAGTKQFRPIACLAENVSGFGPWRALFPGISECHSTLAEDDPFRPADSSYYAAAGVASRASVSR